ncbi:MAG: acyl-[acyl-carrier-protein]--UDP-N-acetylglucosamine O-acyltransferase [Candidatus Omnitrophota bacterium]|nr:MAG: acyl-[acyl-carrier-protein]--UDP-N-acetylglucosamine O-acyltransferase [Candidatus Omnitrophota bacterium]
MQIHPTAIISKNAKIAGHCQIGPYTVIGDAVTVGEACQIGPYCVIEGNTTIGKNCKIFTGAVLGSSPQDLKYKDEKSFLKIGDGNVIREYCTFNPGTEEGSVTKIGNDNLFMAYSHIAHDCFVGSNCIIANNGTLAGHVSIEDKAVVGGLVAIHQFVRVGTLSIIGGCSKVVQDIPPFSTCDGHPARVYGLNLIGLKRQGTARESIKQLHRAFNILFHAGLSKKNSLEKIEKEMKPSQEVSYLINFVRKSERGVVRSCRIERINKDTGIN